MRKENLINLIAAIFILLFSYTAVSKFQDYERFVFQMRLAPLPLMNTIAPVLGVITPILESIIVLLLLFRNTRALGIYSSLILMLLFEIYVGGMLATGKNLPCTCGGIISSMSWKVHFAFNALFILIGAFGVYIIKSSKNTSRYSTKTFTRNDRETVT